ncbi:probable rhamnogalacturonate lyase B [Corylus avellana]|uniref:probable rhamnogalacturonate lyase B n=1 Tax=Corylus avellana TaxID=13451 RepID=UPI001E22C781|nr:probable rhamnogalacturonate lyase B [Corylus avellana]
MENWRRISSLVGLSLVVCFFLIKIPIDSSIKIPRKILLEVKDQEFSDVKLHTHHHQVVVDNGIVRVILSRPDGDVLQIEYNGITNLLEDHNKRENRGYWDVAWNQPDQGPKGAVERIAGTKFRIITNNKDQVELSFTRTWKVSSHESGSVPLNVDKRYIFRRGTSGYYTYSIFERLKGWPKVDLGYIRAAYKLKKDKFHYMALSDDKQRIMPTQKDREKSHALAYPEAVLLTNATNPTIRGEVDDKYQYSSDVKDTKVHGWISLDPPVGFWIITPSEEFRSGGPTKQELTSHVGPTALCVFMSAHYSGMDLEMKFKDGEPWKKVFGPIFVYINSVSHQNDYQKLWVDAKEKMLHEVDSWPYNFTESRDFPSVDQRGTVAGQLLVSDQYISKSLIRGRSAYVGLAAPGEVGSWQRESKGYQFWTQADDEGHFVIKNIRPGCYNLYAWVPGVIGDYKYDTMITIKPGLEVKLGAIVYAPPRHGPTLWEIGIPDRTAAEFYVPDPYPTLTNRLYNHSEKFRQYGLWDRYTDLYHDQDLVYTINVSDYRKDWFFAHLNRNINNGTCESTTWQIKFELVNVNKNVNYTFQLALASAHYAVVQVRFNDARAKPAHFSTGFIGRDNAIARHGIHGLYWLYSIDVKGNLLHEGNNTIYLRQAKSENYFQGVMYDYLRLEGPSEA